MADYLKNVFGGGNAAVKKPVANPDTDFADFAGAPEPVPEAAPVPVAGSGSGTASGPAGAASTTVPWTKWYNIHERHSISEFQTEGLILIIGLVVVVFHLIGARANRSRAKGWIRAHAPILTKEFALVGFGGVPTIDGDYGSEAAPSSKADVLIKEKSLTEFATYATGRQNVAFVDVKIDLTKKFNPIINIFENIFSFFWESAFDLPIDVVETTVYPFDGKENDTVPSLPGSAEVRAKDGKSTYDAFVWAVVNKSAMQKARDTRYDLSITLTKDNNKLPNWLTVMSESAEITDTLLSKELIEAITDAGDLFEYLIISDQPTDKPKTLAEASPSKRLILKYRLPSSNSGYASLAPLFTYFVRLPDVLVQSAHFRPEVVRKVKATREAMTKELKKIADEEKNEERSIEREKAKKAKRDAELAGLDAKAQKKYLEKEKEKEMRKSQKKMTMRG